jgi:hypothetical protein
MVHTPGTVVRASDKAGNFSNAFTRVLKDELCDLEIVCGPEFVAYEFRQVRRGSELALVFFVEYRGVPIVGKEVAINNLPENIVENQPEFIKKAANVFNNI